MKIKSSRSRPAQFRTSNESGEPTPDPFWTPQRLLVLQLSKLLNYYKDDLEPAWGGYASAGEPCKITNAFIDEFVELYTKEEPGPWLAKISPALPWGPDNCALAHDPWPGFGKPYEPYLSIGGYLFQLNYVSEVIRVDEQELIALKLWLLLDQLVIAEAVKGMLRPPPSWPNLPKSKRRLSVKPTYQAQ